MAGVDAREHDEGPSGSVMKRWTVSPVATVRKYQISGPNDSNPVVPTIRVMSANTPMGSSLTMPEVRATIAWKNALKNPTRVPRASSAFRLAIAVPSRMLKKMMGSMSPAAADESTFVGTMPRSRSTPDVGVSSSGNCALPAALPSGAPIPGRNRLTTTRPVVAARKLVSR